jgi:hypothetical protein
MVAKLRTVRPSSDYYCKGPHSLHSNMQVSNETWNASFTSSRTEPAMIKDWRKRIRDNVSATTGVSGELYEISQRRAVFTVNQKLTDGIVGVLFPSTVRFRGMTQYSRVQGYVPTISIIDGVADQEATKKLYRKLNAIQKSLDGLVFMGELRETLRMLRNPAKSLFDSARNDYLAALQRRKHRNPRNWARGLSGAWLEWAFGVTPLVNDINNILLGLDRFNSDPIQTTLLTAVGQQRASPKPVLYDWTPPNHIRIWFKGTGVEKVTQKVKYRAKYVRERSQIKDLTNKQKFAQTFGLNMREFVPTMWELMPWSFLVDYFTNVGDILEQSFSSLEHVAWCNRTQIDTGTRTNSLGLDVQRTKLALTIPGVAEFSGASVQSDAVCTITRRNFARAPFTPQASPFKLEIPGSVQKWLNIAALGVQANSIHPQRFNFRR